MIASGLFEVKPLIIFFREHSFHILIDKFPILGYIESNIVINWRDDEFITKGEFLSKFIQARMS